ncbi:MAG: hypothetical protein ACM3NQ_03720 [Bacteroidales bacterium]
MDRRKYRVLGGLVLLALLIPSPARAQYGKRPPQLATGESYTVEVSFGLWDPEPSINISSDKLSLIGSNVDAVTDLGISKQKFRDLQVVLRLALKHKIRFDYQPVKYTADAVLHRTISYGGVTYDIGVPVHSELEFKSYVVGYEYDFVYRNWGYVGVIGEVRFTDANATLSSLIGSVSASAARAPIPAIGGAVRAYLARNFAVTGELKYFKLPDSISAEHYGRYLGYDVYGTVNFTNNVGAQAGYRSQDLTYNVRTDSGTLNLQGWYLRGVVRF